MLFFYSTPQAFRGLLFFALYELAWMTCEEIHSWFEELKLMILTACEICDGVEDSVPAPETFVESEVFEDHFCTLRSHRMEENGCCSDHVEYVDESLSSELIVPRFTLAT